MPAPFHYIESENFVLNEYGDYFYNECFEKTDIDFFAKQKYKKIIPYTIIKFYDFYLMNTKEERNICTFPDTTGTSAASPFGNSSLIPINRTMVPPTR